MLPISGLYEVAIRVKSLPRAETFYRDILGLEVAIRDPKRPMLFLRVGGDAAMVVLQEDPGEFPKLHFAFTIGEADIERAARVLREKGLAVRGPVFHEWMPARSLYFADPDGHDLELCAPGKRSQVPLSGSVQYCLRLPSIAFQRTHRPRKKEKEKDKKDEEH